MMVSKHIFDIFSHSYSIIYDLSGLFFSYNQKSKKKVKKDLSDKKKGYIFALPFRFRRGGFYKEKFIDKKHFLS